MNKIKEILVEPTKVKVGSTFMLKIKAIRYATYQEIKNRLTFTTVESYSYGQLKGD